MSYVAQELAVYELPTLPATERALWTVVLKQQTNGDLVPWVLSGPSQYLNSINVVGNGLYALRAFRGPRVGRLTDAPGEVVGRYSGHVVGGPFSDPNVPAAVELGTELAQRGADCLLFVKQSNGWMLLDGETSGPPFLSKMNDSRSSSRNNVEFLPNGNARMTKGVPAADLSAGASLLAPSELLVTYGSGFWRFRERLGSEQTPLVVE